jgi:uncharacterized integral membrane protein
MTAEPHGNSPRLVTGTAAGNDPSRPLAGLRPKCVPRSRLGGLREGAVAFALLTLLLLIVVLENRQSVEVSFFGAHGHLSMGVALLLAVVFGILLVALPGPGRSAADPWAAPSPPAKPRRRR